MSDGDVLQVDPAQLIQVSQRVGELSPLIRSDAQQPLQAASEAAVQGWQPGTAVYSYQQLVDQQLQQIQTLHQQIEEWSTLLAQQAQAYVRADTTNGDASLGLTSQEDVLRGLTGGQQPTKLNLSQADVQQWRQSAYYQQVQMASQGASALKKRLIDYANLNRPGSGGNALDQAAYQDLRFKTVATGIDGSGKMSPSLFTVSGYAPTNRQYIIDAYQTAFKANEPVDAADNIRSVRSF